MLSKIIGEPCRVGSVPGGFSSQIVIAQAGRAGIQVLFTSEPETSGREQGGTLVLGRYAIWRHTSADTAAALAAGRLRPRLQQWVLWNGKKVAKRVGGKYWLKARALVLRR
jgi:hypothetical protein